MKGKPPMVTVHEEGRSPVFLSLKTALARLPDDMAIFEATTLALFLGEPVSVVLKDGNGRPASMHLTERANPQIELFTEPKETSDGQSLFRYTSDCTAMLEIPVEVTCLATDEPSATILVEETMNGIREPGHGFSFHIKPEDIEALLWRIKRMAKPRDLAAAHIDVHHTTEQKRLEATS
jgi:hypothetical protein